MHACRLIRFARSCRPECVSRYASSRGCNVSNEVLSGTKSEYEDGKDDILKSELKVVRFGLFRIIQSIINKLRKRKKPIDFGICISLSTTCITPEIISPVLKVVLYHY